MVQWLRAEADPHMNCADLVGAQPKSPVSEPWAQLLSRSPKVLQQLSEPEVFGCHAGLAMRLLRRQRQNPSRGISGLAPKQILLANSSCWEGSHHELGECGLPGSCERRAREPSP
jgi:hypothetical protein